MKRSSILRVLSVAVPIALVAAILPATEVGAKGSSPNGIYNSTISPLPGNMPSVGAEAYAFDEFGNQITFSSTSPGRLSTVVVTMSSGGVSLATGTTTRAPQHQARRSLSRLHSTSTRLQPIPNPAT